MKLSLRVQSVPRVLFGMAPPVCSRCRSCELAFLNDDLRRIWAAERGLAWDWKDDLGYWRLCQACHRKEWPDDRRNRNGSSMPWSQVVAQRPVATKLVEWEGCVGEWGFLFDTAASRVTGHFGLVGSALGPASAAASSAATNFPGGAKGCAALDKLCLQVGWHCACVWLPCLGNVFGEDRVLIY